MGVYHRDRHGVVHELFDVVTADAADVHDAPPGTYEMICGRCSVDLCAVEDAPTCVLCIAGLDELLRSTNALDDAIAVTSGHVLGIEAAFERALGYAKVVP